MAVTHWNGKEEVESPEVDSFLDEIESVCRKHKMSIGHEDSQGAFIVFPFSVPYIKWLRDCHDMRGVKW